MDWANDPGDEGDNHEHEHDREGEVAMDEGDEDEDGGDENDDSTTLLLSVRLVSNSGEVFLASWGVGTIDVLLIGLEQYLAGNISGREDLGCC